jgi:hypothetical protein
LPYRAACVVDDDVDAEALGRAIEALYLAGFAALGAVCHSLLRHQLLDGRWCSPPVPA